MHQDVLDLRAFYYRTRLGRSAQRALQVALRAFWHDVRGQRLAGFGFSVPLLRPFLGEAHCVISLMPAQQGVMPWPNGASNVSTLVEETHWPVPAGSIDRLVIAHGFETSEHPVDLLSEVWRVLAPNGSAVFIVPNRAGLWARRDVTPFGNGRPYTVSQLEAQLERHRFTPMRNAAALYWPPTHRKFWLKTASLWENVGRRYDPRLVAGALLLEAGKQIFARPKGGSPAMLPGALGVLEGLGGSNPRPASSLHPASRDPA
ncbi:MAG: methyltransferase domain-containing protein [Pseudomonadota bacterium]